MKQRVVHAPRPIRFHARVASEIARRAECFASTVSLGTNNHMVNAKRALSLMLLEPESSVQLVTEGPDEEQAVEAIETTIMTVCGW